MIKPLIEKFKAATEQSEMESIYKEIVAEFDNVNFRSQQEKLNSLRLLKENVETYVQQYKVPEFRQGNAKMLDTLSALDDL